MLIYNNVRFIADRIVRIPGYARTAACSDVSVQRKMTHIGNAYRDNWLPAWLLATLLAELPPPSPPPPAPTPPPLLLPLLPLLPLLVSLLRS